MSTRRGKTGGVGRDAQLLTVAAVAFGCVALIAGLAASPTGWPSVILYVVLVFVTMWVYYQYFTQPRFLSSLAFPAFAILIIQCVVYPLYILASGNGRDYLFTGQVADYVPALILWSLGVIGFGLGIAIRQRQHPTLPERRVPEVEREDTKGLVEPRSLFWVTIPLVLVSLGAAYLKYRAYGFGSLEDIANVGAFSADVIRRNRGLGPLTMLEMWSYVAVAYVGWHAYLRGRFWSSSMALGVVYAIAGSALSLVNARRAAIVVHLLLLCLPFLLRAIRSSGFLRKAIPLLLVGVFLLDLVSSAARVTYYSTNVLETFAVRQRLSTLGYAPLSFDQLELSGALLQQVEDGRFKPRWGSTVFAAALNWVPRALWPSKPWTGGPVFAVAMGGAYYFDDSGSSSSITTGLVVETVLNSGLFAFALLPILMMFVGYALSGLDIAHFLRRGSLVWSTAFSLYFWNAAGLFSDDLGGVVTKLIMNTSGLVFVYLLTRMFSRGHANSGAAGRLRATESGNGPYVTEDWRGAR